MRYFQGNAAKYPADILCGQFGSEIYADVLIINQVMEPTGEVTLWGWGLDEPFLVTSAKPRRQDLSLYLVTSF